MDYFRVNGKKYEVTVVSLEENFNILYSENTGRTLADGAPMMLDPLGTFFGHKVVVKRKHGYEKEFDELYKLVSKPLRVEDEEDALLFEVAHLQDTIAYRAYVSNGTRAVIKIDEKTNKVYWGELSLNIVPIKAQVLPDSVVNEDAGDEPPETDGGDTDTITFRIEDIQHDDGTLEYSTYNVPRNLTWEEAVNRGYLPNYSIQSLMDWVGDEGNGVYNDAIVGFVGPYGESILYVDPTKPIEEIDYILR